MRHVFRWRAFVCCLLGWLVAGCAYDDAFEPDSLPPEVVYRRPPVLREPEARRPEPSRPPRRSATEAWYPIGRRIDPRWKSIIIHHSATTKGGAASFDRHHRNGNGWDELGYHFVIGNGTDTPDGFIEVGSRWHKQKHGAHCKTPDNFFNDHGIGICLVGDFSQRGPSAKQLASLRKLVAFLTDECRIPSGRVYSHGEINHSTKCPGKYFPMIAFRRSLNGPATASAHPGR